MRKAGKFTEASSDNITINIDVYDISAAQIRRFQTKYGIKITAINGEPFYEGTGETASALVTGSAANIQKFLSSDEYYMDIDDQKELFPELFTKNESFRVGKFTESVKRILEADEAPKLLSEAQAEDMVTAIFAKEKALQELRREVPEVLEKSDRFIFQYKLKVDPNSPYALLFETLVCEITIRKTATKEKEYGARISFDYEHPDGGSNGIYSDNYVFNANLDIVDVIKA